jgi:hypothetical protein
MSQVVAARNFWQGISFYIRRFGSTSHLPPGTTDQNKKAACDSVAGGFVEVE